MMGSCPRHAADDGLPGSGAGRHRRAQPGAVSPGARAAARVAAPPPAAPDAPRPPPRWPRRPPSGRRSRAAASPSRSAAESAAWPSPTPAPSVPRAGRAPAKPGRRKVLARLQIDAPQIILFETNEARLDREAQAAIDRLARRLANLPATTLVIEGHTDVRGAPRQPTTGSAGRAPGPSCAGSPPKGIPRNRLRGARASARGARRRRPRPRFAAAQPAGRGLRAARDFVNHEPQIRHPAGSARCWARPVFRGGRPGHPAAGLAGGPAAGRRAVGATPRRPRRPGGPRRLDQPPAAGAPSPTPGAAMRRGGPAAAGAGRRRGAAARPGSGSCNVSGGPSTRCRAAAARRRAAGRTSGPTWRTRRPGCPASRRSSSSAARRSPAGARSCARPRASWPGPLRPTPSRP